MEGGLYFHLTLLVRIFVSVRTASKSLRMASWYGYYLNTWGTSAPKQVSTSFF